MRRKPANIFSVRRYGSVYLIKPNSGFVVAYVDWSAQEFAISAVLSGDEDMITSYLSGDPYLAFAKASGAVPKTATKHSHPKARDVYKLCSLGILYGMSAKGLAIYSGKRSRGLKGF